MLKYKDKVCLFSNDIKDRSVFFIKLDNTGGIKMVIMEDLEHFIDDSYFIMKKKNAYYLNGGYLMALDDNGILSKDDIDILTTRNQRHYKGE